MQDQGLWKSWHGDTHFIADDDLDWKDKCPTFRYVLDKLQKYFNIDIKSTRLNWYKDTNDWKPYHHDAAAIKPHIASFIVSFSITFPIGFFLSKYVVWNDSNLPGKKQFTRHLFFVIFSVFLNYALLKLFVDYFL